MAEEICAHCGAPRVAGYAACKFCATPFVQNTQTGAIPCPRCNTLNEMGVQKCVQCQTWVVVQCVFCHALSPHNVPGCLKCGEAFAGAPQRFADQQRQQHLQQGLSIAGTVGNVAASFLGAAAGAGVFSGHHHESYGYEHHHREGYEYVPREEYVQESSPVIAGSESGGGFFSSLFGGDAPSDGGGANIQQSNEPSGGGFFDSLTGGSSDDAGGSDDSGSSDDDNS
jgi:hypothetical protein